MDRRLALCEAGIPLGHAPSRSPIRGRDEYCPHMTLAQLDGDHAQHKGYGSPRGTCEHEDCEDDGYYGYHGVSGVRADHEDASCVGPDVADFASRGPGWLPSGG